MKTQLLVLNTIALALVGSTLVRQEGAIAFPEAQITSAVEALKVGMNGNSRFYQDGRTPAQKQEVQDFQAGWAKSNPAISQFLGDWYAIEETKKIYPSKTQATVCIIDTFLARNGLGYELTTGVIKNDRIYTKKGDMLILANSNRGKFLASIFSRPDNGQLGSYAYANPRPLVAPSDVGSSVSYADDIGKLAPQFEQTGCSADLPKSRDPKPRQKPSDSYSEKEFVQAWSSVNPALKPFLGTWLEPEGNIRIYPATVKDRVCLVVNTSGEMIVDIGMVTNGQIAKLSEGGGPYISRRGKPGERSWTDQPENKELLVSVNSRGNLVAWRFLNRDTTSIKVQHPSQGLQGLPQEILRGRSAEIQKFDRTGCTAGLPEKPIAQQPTTQQPTELLQPIAAASTYAYPSPAEFAQFKKTLKPSPVALSTTDRKLRQDFQAEWQKKNRAIAPYVGAWKTADNQDVYVFPSTVSQRACVVRQKDGQLEMKLAVSMTADMRFDGNTGMFKVDPMTDVVAGRSDKSEPLSALYGAIGSPEVSASVREELVQAGCVSELPKVVAETKPRSVSNPSLENRTREGPKQ
jgi:hypothetical protein